MKNKRIEKSYTPRFLGFLLLLLLQSTAHGQGLAGDYVIGSAPADFTDLETAILELGKQGMTAPVKFLLKAEEFETHVNIDSIPRLGQTDDLLTITSADEGTQSTLFYEATGSADNWVIQLEGVTHVKIQDLTLEARGNNDFAKIVDIKDDSTFIEISDNVFNNYFPSISAGVDEASSLVADSVSNVSDINIIGNQFLSGGGAIHFEGMLNNQIESLNIANNHFDEQMGTGGFYALKLLSINDLTVIGNVVTNHQDNAKGVDLFRAYGALFDGNQINMLGGGNGSVALRVFFNNVIGGGDTVVSNNFIQAAKTGVWISSGNSRVKLLHNSIVVSGFASNQTNHAVLIGANDNEDIEVINNIIQSKNALSISKVMEISDSTAILESNHNVFKGEVAMDFEFTVNGNDYPAFADYQASTFFDAQSIDKAIDFVNQPQGDLHLTLMQYSDADLKTVTLPEVGIDIDGEPRSPVTPLIGADDVYSDLIFVSGFE